MDTTELNFPLLDRIRRALDIEMRQAVALAGEIVNATRALSVAYTTKSEALRVIQSGPDRARFAGMSAEAARELLNAEANARAQGRLEHRRIEKVAGRPPISEVIRDHAAAAERAGADPGVAAELAARAALAPDQSSLAAAFEAARRNRIRAETALHDLEEQRGAHGRRAGQLRQSIHEAETWMAANGVTVMEAA